MNRPGILDGNAPTYELGAGSGTIEGSSSVTAFGYISNAGASITNVNAWQPQVAWDLPSAPVHIEYSSDSTNDSAGGTGARQIVSVGVGPNFAFQIEITSMNGTNKVQSAYTWLAINTLVVNDDPVNGFGSAKGNVGNITAQISGGGAVQGYIVAGKGVSTHGRYTVPAGFTWVVNNFFIIGNKTASPSASYGIDAIFVTPNGLVIYGLPQTLSNGTPSIITLPHAPVQVLQKMTLMFRISSVSTSGLNLSIGCTGLQTKNI